MGHAAEDIRGQKWPLVTRKFKLYHYPLHTFCGGGADFCYSRSIIGAEYLG
jgi:hypothetical protein